MTSLLVQSCSKSKNEPGESVPALELYSGYFFKIIKKAIREGEFDESMDVCILSAKYGLIDASEEISWYDQRMDTDRAVELAPHVCEELSERASGEYDEVLINVGGAYRRVIEDIEAAINIPVRYIEGDGIGYKGRRLKQVIRGKTTSDSNRSLVTSGI